MYFIYKNDCFILQCKMKQVIFGILVLVCIAACQQKSWQQTASGIQYKIFTNDTSKPKPIYGDHIWMHLRKYTHTKKEIFNTSIFDNKNGVELEFKKSANAHDILSYFTLLGRGDSMWVRIPMHLVDSNSTKKKYYTFHLNLLNFKRAEIYHADKKMQAMHQAVADSLAIVDYIRNKQLQNFKQDMHGIWFVRTQTKSITPIKMGDSVSIHYKGYLTNNWEFDNSFQRNKPLTFVIGKKQVIEGLDKGIQHFYKGETGTIIIPSRLAYEDKEVGKIPPNSILIFDIEVLENQ